MVCRSATCQLSVSISRNCSRTKTLLYTMYAVYDDSTESHATLIRRFCCYTFFLSLSVTIIRRAFALRHYKTHYSIYSLNFKTARDRKFVTMYRTQRTTVIDVDMAST